MAASTCLIPGQFFSREAIAGLAGRPYAEVAVELIRPFVGDAVAEADLARMAREAYDGFRHPAVVPLVQYGPNCFLAELFHGPTLAFKDLAMQLLARLMDHVLAQARRAGDHRRGDVRGYRRCRRRGVSRPRACRSRRAVSARAHLRGAAADDDDGQGRQRPCDRHRRHVRRLPGDREGPVQPPRFPRPGAAVRHQFDQLGAHRRPGGLLFRHRGGARSPAPQGRLHRADRQFRRHFRGLRGLPHGPADRSAGDRHQRQRHPGADAGDRRLRAARRHADHLALDGHPGVVEFRAAAVRRRAVATDPWSAP